MTVELLAKATAKLVELGYGESEVRIKFQNRKTGLMQVSPTKDPKFYRELRIMVIEQKHDNETLATKTEEVTA